MHCRSRAGNRLTWPGFSENGFDVADLAVPTHELVWLQEVLRELIARGAEDRRTVIQDLAPPGNGSGYRLAQVLEPELVVPDILNMTAHRAARSVASLILGCDGASLRFFGHMVLKAALQGPETPWHQDVAYWQPGRDYQALSVWLPLIDTTVESGCMQFIPRSHRGPVHTHRRTDNNPALLLEAVGVETTAAVACPVPAGVATIHDCKTLHYAGPNRTSSGRPAFIQTFLR